MNAKNANWKKKVENVWENKQWKREDNEVWTTCKVCLRDHNKKKCPNCKNNQKG